MKTDVALLADVFENFRNLCQEQYGLDPAHYFTSPGLSWDALLKKTGVELELFTDLEMHLFVERGMRAGISMVSKRYAKANNPQVPDYDPSKPGKTMENLRNRVDIKIVRSNETDKIRKLVASPLYSRHAMFSNDPVGIHMRKSRLLINKPVYTGMTILDNSKILMYDVFYNELKKIRLKVRALVHRYGQPSA